MDIRTILCPVDLSSIAERELGMASQLSERLGARLVLQHTIGGPPPVGLAAAWMFAEEHEQLRREEEAESRKRIRELMRGLPKDVRVEAVLAWGPLERMLLELARALPADLIVMGTHGRSNAEHASLTGRLIVEAPCPLLTTRDASSDALLPDFGAAVVPTLVPMDFTAHSKHALGYAFELARRLPLRLHLVHACKAGNGNFEDATRALRALVPVDLAERVEIDVREDGIVEGILRCEADRLGHLMVMATHRRGLIERLFAPSTARELLYTSPCPVWFVPEEARVAEAAA